MMTCVIVDDNEMSRKALEQLCKTVDDLEVKQLCPDGLSALNYLREHSVDLVFLDVEMPEITGLELLEHLDDYPQIIITTTKKEYAVEAFEHEVTDYLTKPITINRFLKAVERARQIHSEKVSQAPLDELFLRSEGRIVRISLDDLLYVETLGDYVTFRTTTEKHIVHSTLKNIDGQLKDPRFLKVHRSFIVNLTKIVDIEETNLVIADQVIPISRAHKPVLMNRIKLIS